MKTKSEVIKLLKEGYKIFVDCEDETGILYSIFKENGLYNPFKIEKGMCYYLTKSLPVNIRVTEFQNDYKTINLAEIEPDNEKANDSEYFDNENFAIVETKNEKPYLFYEGEKYYFGEEYEFSDDKEEWGLSKLIGFESIDSVSFTTHLFHNYEHIRKIDHTSKYKKRFLELKIQAEKDGVNLKELI